MIRICFFIFTFIILQPSLKADIETTTNSPRFIVHLLDYLAKDYVGSVGKNGEILSESEYAEQIEFSRSAFNTSQELPELKKNELLQEKLTSLLTNIQSKSSPDIVTPLAREIQRDVIQITNIELQPLHWPSLNDGRKLYATNCTLCHGSLGKGDGPGAAGLDPIPANFVDKDGMQSLTPFAAFNTIRLGVPGTGMIAFPQLSDQEVWELSFYINSLRFENDKVIEFPAEWSPDDNDTLMKVASLSDADLKDKISGNNIFKNEILASLRRFVGKNSPGDFLSLAQLKLSEANEHFINKEFALARTKALQAYLEGIEPIEAKLRASDPESVVEIEERMSLVRSNIESKKSNSDVNAAIASATLKIHDIRPLVEGQKMSPWMAFLAAFAIILREGFEAVLIILALLGITRAAGSKSASRHVHAGWILALSLGLLAWIFSGWLMDLSGASREKLEGITSIFAVSALLYVGFWLHRQTEIGRWKKFIEMKVKKYLTGGKLIGLALISFVAVFREAIETVLFLRVIWIDLSPIAKTALFSGVFTSFALVIALSWLALNYTRRLPLKTLFNFSSVMMLILATILAGKGVHSLQEAGVFGVDAFPLRIRSELLGLYPTVQTITAQVFTALAVLALWFIGKKPSSQPVKV